jgi:hypothetical protein
MAPAPFGNIGSCSLAIRRLGKSLQKINPVTIIFTKEFTKMSIYQFESAEDVDLGSTYVSQEGTYHFVVNEMEDRPQDESGREQDYLQVTAIVLDGTAASQVGRQIRLRFFPPNLNSKDQGKFSKKKLTRLFEALGFTSPETRGKTVSLELDLAVGRQFVAEIERQTYEIRHGKRAGQTGERFDLAYASIFHVDDPAVKEIPKQKVALAEIPKALRRDPKSFGKRAGSLASEVSLDDI